MRWSIRSQILIPLIGIQAVAVTAATLTTAALAARRSEGEIIGRLNDVLDTLAHGNFPYLRQYTHILAHALTQTNEATSIS